MVIYIFTGDFFPTLLRNQAYGAASFSGRIGGILIPYVLYLGKRSLSLFSRSQSYLNLLCKLSNYYCWDY